MNLLCWHGTVLRVDKATGAMFHALPWPDDDSGEDLVLDVPDMILQHPLQVDGLVVEPAPAKPRIFVRRERHYLRAEPFRPPVEFASVIATPHETFIAVTPAVLAGFRAVLRGPSRIAETGAVVQAVRADGFMLSVQNQEFPLWTAQAGPDGGLVVDDGGLVRTLIPEPPKPAPRRIPVPSVAAESPARGDAQSFLKGRTGSFLIASGDDMLYPPVTLTEADQIWVQRKAWWPHLQRFGPVKTECEMRRVRGAFVMTGRGLEGAIFDESGVYTDPVNLQLVTVFSEAPITRHGLRVFVDEPALRGAPVIQGPHVVFYSGNVSNYFHWLIEALVPLCAMAPHLPAGTKLLLPETLDQMREDHRAALLPTHHAMLRDWGFGDMPRTVVPSPVCLVEEVFYLHHFNLESFPASVLHGARARVLADLPPVKADKLIYIRRPAARRVDNAAEIEEAVTRLGFTVHEMRGLSAADQIALFRSASFVISPHGADLSNLLFCAPGTRVIELSPDVHFRYFFAQISDKLGLSHAVLPCASVAGNFDRDMHVDCARLLALVQLMQARS